MTLQDTIRAELKEAMKSGDAFKRDVLRMLESAVKNAAIEKKLERDAVADEVVQEVVKRAIKQRRDSVEQYTAGGRTDLAEKEQQEIEVLQVYLPEQLSEEEVRQLVAEAQVETGASSPQDFGKLMKAAMQKVAGRADGTVVKRVVDSILTS